MVARRGSGFLFTSVLEGGELGHCVDAGADGHQPPRDTVFIDADVLPLSDQVCKFTCSVFTCSVPISKPGPPEVKVEVWV